MARKGVGFFPVALPRCVGSFGSGAREGGSALLEMARFALWADALADGDVGTTVVPTLATAGSAHERGPRGGGALDRRPHLDGGRGRAGREGAFRAYAPADPGVGVEVEREPSRPPMEATVGVDRASPGRRATPAALGCDLAAARVGGVSDGNLTAAAGIPTLDGLGPRGGGAHARASTSTSTTFPWRAALLAAPPRGGRAVKTRCVQSGSCGRPRSSPRRRQVGEGGLAVRGPDGLAPPDLIAATHAGGLTAGAFEAKRMLGFVHGIPRTNLGRPSSTRTSWPSARGAAARPGRRA